MTIIVFGIPNCDTVKKARTWLDAHGVAYTFHDYKKAGVAPELVAQWIAVAGLDKVLNRAGTTFRKLSDADKADVDAAKANIDAAKANIDAAKAVALMVVQPSLIRRPIVVHPGGLLVGFKEPEWDAALG